MQTAGQRNPGLKLAAELSTQEGREEKQHQSKRGRSQADNEEPCSVSSAGEGAREEK